VLYQGQMSVEFVPEPEARAADRQFAALTTESNLDRKLQGNPAMAARFERVLGRAISAAYREEPGIDAAHQFLHRALYRVNRLSLFWYDDLRRYVNERSPYLLNVRERIESAWQGWEARALDLDRLRRLDVLAALRERAQADLDPPISDTGRYFARAMTLEGYRRLLQIGALDGLVEASQLSRTLGGAANEVHATLTRVLVEEYGGGRLARKHSTFFAVMLRELGLSAEPEAYFDLVPWEVLASINQSFLLSDRKRHFLRYVGGLLYFETSTPAAFRNYRAAADRLGLSERARGYWDVHIREDERHGRWMLDGVALPLAASYPADAWEIVLGYDQQKRISERAAAALARAARDADQVAVLRAAA